MIICKSKLAVTKAFYYQHKKYVYALALVLIHILFLLGMAHSFQISGQVTRAG